MAGLIFSRGHAIAILVLVLIWLVIGAALPQFQEVGKPDPLMVWGVRLLEIYGLGWAIVLARRALPRHSPRDNRELALESAVLKRWAHVDPLQPLAVVGVGFAVALAYGLPELLLLAAIASVVVGVKAARRYW